MSTFDDNMAHITARSIAGSETFSPPTLFRNTSFCANLKPTRFSSTASSMFIRLPSKPVTERWGVPYAAVLTSACTSMKNGRMPSTVTPMAVPDRSS